MICDDEASRFYRAAEQIILVRGGLTLPNCPMTENFGEILIFTIQHNH